MILIGLTSCSLSPTLSTDSVSSTPSNTPIITRTFTPTSSPLPTNTSVPTITLTPTFLPTNTPEPTKTPRPKDKKLLNPTPTGISCEIEPQWNQQPTPDHMKEYGCFAFSCSGNGWVDGNNYYCIGENASHSTPWPYDWIPYHPLMDVIKK